MKEESLFQKFEGICRLVAGGETRTLNPAENVAAENIFLREYYGKSAEECSKEEKDAAISALAMQTMEELDIRSGIPRSLEAVADAIAQQRATKH